MAAYVDEPLRRFWQITGDALTFAVLQSKATLSDESRTQLLDALLATKSWPDALPAFKRMKTRGLHLAFLANLTKPMLDRWVENAGLEGIFDPHLSTDLVKVFKPDPRAYQMSVDHFRCPKSSIAFAAFGGRDAAGAKAFGYPMFWVNLAWQPTEELGLQPDAQGYTLDDLDADVAGSSAHDDEGQGHVVTHQVCGPGTNTSLPIDPLEVSAV